MNRTLAMVVLAMAAWAAVAVGGENDTPVATEIRKQYWQALKGAVSVTVDNRGLAWFKTSGRQGVEATYDSDFKCLAGNEWFLLGDSKGRVWIESRNRTRMYDGKKWHIMGFIAKGAMEDSSGRVFMATRTHMNVLGLDGKWSQYKHPIGEGEVYGQWRMREGPLGEVWITSEWRRTRKARAWCWRQGKWHYVTAADGLPFDRIDAVTPLGEGRYLVTTVKPKGTRNFAVWSWAAAGGKAAAEDEVHQFMPGMSADQLSFFGIDLDGNTIFIADNPTRDGGPVGTERSAVVGFSPKGKGFVLSTEGKTFASAAAGMRLGDKLFFSRRDRRFWGGNTLHLPHVLGDGYTKIRGFDRLGRIYYHPTSRSEVQVLWPARQCPGDVLRFVKPQDLPRRVHQLLPAAAGGIWLNTRRALLQWRKGQVLSTPVEVKPHPPWRAEGMPPWTAWSQFQSGPLVFEGRSGASLAVTIRDVYQDIVVDENRPGDWRRIRAAGGRAGEAGKAIHWPEAWLYHNGKWSGPTKVADLLRQEAALLVKTFTTQTPEFSWFDLQSDGKWVWAAYNGTVYAVSPKGKVMSFLRTPSPESRGAGHWRLTSLVCMGDGKAWCVYPTEQGREVWALSAGRDAISAKALPGADWREGYRPTGRILVARDQRVWRYGSSSHPSEWRDGKWHEHKDLGQLVLEDDDGALWFTPPNRSSPSATPQKADNFGLVALYGGKRHYIASSADIPLWGGRAYIPHIIRIAPGRYITIHGRHIVQFARAGDGKPGRWQIGRVHLVEGNTHLSVRQAVLDNQGNLVTCFGLIKSFPTAAPQAKDAKRPAAKE